MVGLRSRFSRHGYEQVAQLERLLRPYRLRGDTLRIRVGRSSQVRAGTVDIVAVIRAGDRVRAVDLQVCTSVRPGWQLTLCHLVQSGIMSQ